MIIESDIIHVVIAIYDPSGTYSRHAGVLAASMFANTKEPICLHILHDQTLAGINREKLIHLTKDYNQSIDLIDVTEKFCLPDWDIDGATERFTRGSLFRLLVPEVINTSKVIYLDCDIVVNLDIKDLWNVNLESYALAGVLDNSKINGGRKSTFSTLKMRARAMGLIPGQYINTGVLVMNLDKMRQHGNLVKRACAYLNRYESKMPDQDFLNAEFLNDIMAIDDHYNIEPKEVNSIYDLHGYIWHFVGFGKPWIVCSDTDVDVLYWNFLSITPWRNELIPSMLKVSRNNLLYHRHSSACVKRLMKQLTTNIVRGNPIPFLRDWLSVITGRLNVKNNVVK